MADFILRNVDDALWRDFKQRAESEGRSMRWIVTTMITQYTENGLPVLTRATAPSAPPVKGRKR